VLFAVKVGLFDPFEEDVYDFVAILDAVWLIERIPVLQDVLVAEEDLEEEEDAVFVFVFVDLGLADWVRLCVIDIILLLEWVGDPVNDFVPRGDLDKLEDAVEDFVNRAVEEPLDDIDLIRLNVCIAESVDFAVIVELLREEIEDVLVIDIDPVDVLEPVFDLVWILDGVYSNDLELVCDCWSTVKEGILDCDEEYVCLP
jgi:hypothetical protein